MKIVHFNTSLVGGSAVLMMRLHRELRHRNHDSQVRFRQGNPTADQSIQQLEFCNASMDKLLERGRYSFENRLVGSDPISYYSRLRLHRATPMLEQDFDCDLIHLHWVGRWLDLPSFIRSLPPNIPIIWTIHDMSPLAGGCFLDFGCGEFGNGCKRCPLLKKPFDRLLASSELNRRQKALADRPVVAVANSASTAHLVERSQLFSRDAIHTIHPGLNFSKLQQHGKAEAKRTLGIETGRLVLGFGAASLTDRNKGIDRFFDVASAVLRVRPETEVLLFGDGAPSCPHPNLKIHHQGTVLSTEQLSVAMSAMDAFIVTSQMETFGQVAVEAQACGTPVWAFDVGGLPETLVPGVTGGLIPYAETAKMAEEILACAASGRLREMGAAGAAWVWNRFSNEEACRQYVALYRNLVGSGDQSPTALN